MRVQSRPIVADKSGAKITQIIGTYGGIKKALNPGQRVKVAIKKVEPNKKVKKGEMAQAIIVRTKRKIKSKKGIAHFKHFQNAVVLVENKMTKRQVKDSKMSAPRKEKDTLLHEGRDGVGSTSYMLRERSPEIASKFDKEY